MAAFRIPGGDFSTNQGLIDDGEHGGARAMMKTLFKEKSDNSAVFVVRYYGGKHLGTARFQAIEKAAKSAINKLQEATLQARRPLSQEELIQVNNEIQQAAEQQQQQLLQQQQQWADAEDSQSEVDTENDSIATYSQSADSN